MSTYSDNNCSLLNVSVHANIKQAAISTLRVQKLYADNLPPLVITATATPTDVILNPGLAFLAGATQSLAGVMTADDKSTLDGLQSSVGQPDGLAQLNSNGKVPLSQLDLQGGGYDGTWDAAANVPQLLSGQGIKGTYYVVEVAGGTVLDSEVTWDVGDWAVFSGIFWEKIPHVNVLTSLSYDALNREVQCSTGTSAFLPLASSSLAGLMSSTDKAILDSKGQANGLATLDSTGKIPSAQVPTTSLALGIGTSNVVISISTGSSTGTSVTLPSATSAMAGAMASSNYSKLLGIQAGAQVNAPTNLSYTASSRQVLSSTGTSAILPLASSSLAGLMSSADKVILASLGNTNLSFNSSTREVLSSTGTSAVLPLGTKTLPGLNKKKNGWDTTTAYDDTIARTLLTTVELATVSDAFEMRGLFQPESGDCVAPRLLVIYNGVSLNWADASIVTSGVFLGNTQSGSAQNYDMTSLSSSDGALLLDPAATQFVVKQFTRCPISVELLGYGIDRFVFIIKLGPYLNFPGPFVCNVTMVFELETGFDPINITSVQLDLGPSITGRISIRTSYVNED